MSESINKTVNVFPKNFKNYQNRNKSKSVLKTMPTADINNNKIRKSFNQLSLSKQKKKFFDFKKVKPKTYLDDKDNDNDLHTPIFKSPHLKKMSNIIPKKINIVTSQKDNLNTPRIKSNLLFGNVIRSKNKKKTIVNNNILFNKKDKNNDKDINDRLYFKFRRKECKSSSNDGFKKRYKLYKDNFLENDDLNESIVVENNKELYQNTTNKNNNIFNYLNIKTTNNNLNKNEENLNVKPYISKLSLNNLNNIKNNNNLYLYSKKKSNNFLLCKNNNEFKKKNSKDSKNNINEIHSSNSETFKGKAKAKKSSNLIFKLPIIKNDNTHKSLNLKMEKKKKQHIPLINKYEKNSRNKKGDTSSKKTTTINIYNNKINNINNIILNDKKIKNKINEKKNSNKEEESEVIKSSNFIDTENNNGKNKNTNYKKLKLSDKEENEEDEKEENDPENKENKNDSEYISNRNNSFTQITNELDDKLDLSNDDISNKMNNANEKRLIRRLSINFNNDFLSQVPMSKRKGLDNIDVNEKKIRKKILKSNSIIQEMNFQKNLNKIKKEITTKLFEELSKKISIDIEEKENIYKNKQLIEFDQKYMIQENNEYIKKVHKKTRKLIKKINNFIYITKNKNIKVYEKNISDYSKITIHESNYLFFKYLYNNYFYYITNTVLHNKDSYKKLKNNTLQLIYNVNNSSNSFSSSTLRLNENYFHSLFFQYLLMEKDKMQKYLSNEEYLDKTVIQIKNLVKEAKAKINDLPKTGNIKINLVINNNGNEVKNLEKNNNDNDPNRNNIKNFIGLTIKKSEYSDTDRYDSKSGYDTQGIFPGRIIFNYKSRNNNINEINNIKEEDNPSLPNKKNVLMRKTTFNHELFHSNFSNCLNNNNNTINLEAKLNIENKYNLTLINKEKIEKKYDHNITKNNDYFFKRKKNIKSKKKQSFVTPKKEINFLRGNYMFKNMLDYRTDEIKTNIKQSIKSPVEMLFYQIKEHDFDEFCDLFERKQIDLNARNPDKDSFLIYAVKCKAMNFVQYLLKRGIDVNLENKFGNTALHYAFSDQNFELADILLQNGADEFKANIFGQTPWQCLGEKKI